ncbi:hypothetical protein FS837_006450, partial [Tulasnella sp. UAMH 9824]
MFMFYSSSSVGSSSAETNSTAINDVEPARGGFVFPCLKSNQPADVLPRSLYPILPPPTPYRAAQAPPVSKSPLLPFSSSHLHLRSVFSSQDVDGTPPHLTNFNPYDLTSNHDRDLEFQHKNVENNADNGESGSKRELKPQSSDRNFHILGTARVLSAKERIVPIEAERAVTRPASPRRAATNPPAKYTWTYALSQQHRAQNPRLHEVEIYNVPSLGPEIKRRMIADWSDKDKATLRAAARRWWRDVGAGLHKRRKRVFLVRDKEDPCYKWMLAECKRMDEEFDRKA